MTAEFNKFEWLRAAEGVRLTGSERAVMQAYYNHAKADGTEAFPSEERIAAAALISLRSVQRGKRKLIKLGLLKLEKRGRKGSGTSVYRLVMPETQPVILNPSKQVQPAIDGGLNPPRVAGITDPLTVPLRDCSKEQSYTRHSDDGLNDRPTSEPALEADSATGERGQQSAAIYHSPIAEPKAPEGGAERSHNNSTGSEAPTMNNSRNPWAEAPTLEALPNNPWVNSFTAPDGTPKWPGWEEVLWPASERLPKYGEPDYNPRARFYDETTGEFLGVCVPPPPKRPEPKHNDFGSDLGDPYKWTWSYNHDFKTA